MTFLKSFGGDGFHVAELQDDDIERMAELVEAYVSLAAEACASVRALAKRWLRNPP